MGSGRLSDATLARVRPASRAAAPPPAASAPRAERASDGALQLLSILQRDSRLVDFLMEDIASYSDAPAGGAQTARFVGNVPAQLPEGGVLRHRGWRAAKVDLPATSPRQDATVIAPAELEVE